MPSFVVHDLAQARAALAAARERGIAVTLVSPPDGARSLGPLYFLAMIEAAAHAVPEARFSAVLDCADAPGLALAALRAGLKAVRVEAPAEVRAKIADIAAQSGAALVEVAAADGIDLSAAADPLALARAHLASPTP